MILSALGKAICGLGWQLDTFGFAFSGRASRNLTTVVREMGLCFCAAFEVRVLKIHASYFKSILLTYYA